jgi:hypothetical protein
MKNKALIFVGIAVLGYVGYKYFYKKPQSKTIAPPPTSTPTTKPLDLKPTMVKNPNL